MANRWLALSDLSNRWLARSIAEAILLRTVTPEARQAIERAPVAVRRYAAFIIRERRQEVMKCSQ